MTAQYLFFWTIETVYAGAYRSYVFHCDLHTLQVTSYVHAVTQSRSSRSGYTGAEEDLARVRGNQTIAGCRCKLSKTVKV